jgi:hypothetical protein
MSSTVINLLSFNRIAIEKVRLQSIKIEEELPRISKHLRSKSYFYI